MADIVDIANEFEELITENNLAHIRGKASEIPKGEAGECDYCGEWYPRIVDGGCARCRDKRGLP